MTLDLQSCIERIVAALGSTEVFTVLAEPPRRALAARMAVESFMDGDVVIQQDTVPDAAYLVLSGALGVTSSDSTDGVGWPPDASASRLVGETCLVSCAVSPFSVLARGETSLAVLPRAEFDRFAEADPASALQVIEALTPSLQRQRLWAALRKSEMFRQVDLPALVDLASAFELVTLYGGQQLFAQGDPGDCLYLVLAGRLRVMSVAPDGSETLLAEPGSGETVGEMAVLSGERRSATVFTTRDTQLARLSTARVHCLTERHPHAMHGMITGQLIRRLRETSRNLRRRASVTTIALFAAGPDVALGEFAATLATALSRLGSTLHLTSGIVDAHVGRSGAAQAPGRYGDSSGVLEWLAQQEREHAYVVYQADPILSPWTERCLRQADRAVLVADASDEPKPGDVERDLLATRGSRRAPLTLVLLHAAGTRPAGTARWLAGRVVERHLHVRRDVLADGDRVARFLTGTAVGLTLGGGFARGIAHLGVLRALDELGIPVDAVGGSSMGAMVGALWALGWEPTRIVHELQTGFAESFDDMTIPFVAFKRGGKHSRLVQRLFGDAHIEDLPTPFFCVSANLNRAELKVHTSGALAEAVVATTRAPGIFPPTVIDGELHVDGGLINNVPVDVMKSFANDGVVVGVDVSPPHELNAVADYGHDVSGWRAIWHRFNPTPEKRVYRPSILLVLMRAIEFGGISYRKQKADLADVYIAPDVLRFKRNDFHAAEGIAQAGYEAARERLREWLAAAPEGVRARRPDLFGESDAMNAPAPAPRRHIRSLFGALLVVVATVGSASCRPQQAVATASAPGSAAAGDAAIGCLGHIEPGDGVIRLGARSLSGQTSIVGRLLVKEGDTVKAHQVVAELDSKDQLLAAQQQAAARIEVARRRLAQVEAGAKPPEVAAQQAEIDRLQGELDNARRTHQRYVTLGDLVTPLELDRLQLAVDSTTRALEGARQRLAALTEPRAVDVDMARAELGEATRTHALAKAEYEASIIRSPIDGRVLKIHAWPGEDVQGEGIMELAPTDPMYVVAEVAESDVTRVKVGQRASISGDGLPARLEGTVARIGLKVLQNGLVPVDPASFTDGRVVNVWIKLDDGRVAAQLIHMRVDVTIGS